MFKFMFSVMSNFRIVYGNMKWLFICLVLVSETVICDHFVNKFAVHIPGGERVARAVADKHGYIHLGQIGSLEDHYLFEHPHVHRRSASHSTEHHQHLSSHPHVHWFEQQKIVSRKKRDFLQDTKLNIHKRAPAQGTDPGTAGSGAVDQGIAKQDLKFNDELYNKMWYYNKGGLDHTDMNVQGAWRRGVTGKNVVISILDDGIERTHDDLKDNYRHLSFATSLDPDQMDPYASYDVNGHDSDPMPRYDYTNENRHGTRCAGEVSAKANNTKCIVGVAYDSKIGGVRMLDGDVYDAVEATSLSHNRSHIDIYSASWGPDDDGRVVDGPGVLAKRAFIDGVRLGRNGKGSIFVWASGNGGNQKDSCNCDGYTNSIYTLSISSISQKGRKPWYLEECSSTLATTYSSGAYSEKQIGRKGRGCIFVWASGNGGRMQDSCSCDGYTNSIYTMSISSVSEKMHKPFYLEECASTLATTFSSGGGAEKQVITVDLHNKCTETHTGTSASAPLAAGIVALMLEVNPTMTWRDVQYVTLMTSRPLPDGTWVTNGVGRQVSLRYGYGLMDATAMVELAEKWTNVPEQHICKEKSLKATDTGPSVIIPDSGYEEMMDTTSCAGTGQAINYLEHVQAQFKIRSKRRGALIIHLTSPQGTRSTILPERPNDSDRVKGFDEWAFLSVHFWGENPSGRWKLEIEVSKRGGYIGSSSYAGSQSTNQLVDWQLIMYGTEANPVNLVKPTQVPGSSVPTAAPGTRTVVPASTVTTAPPTVKNCHIQCLGGCSGPGADNCNSCRFYKMQVTGMCVQSCPNNYYADGFICNKCTDTCETCTYVSTKQVMCLKCRTGFLLVEGKGSCERFCEKGYYKDESSHHCRVCSGVCAECNGGASKCTACRPGTVPIKETCIHQAEPCRTGKCKASQGPYCIRRTRDHMTEFGCKPCPTGCFSCSSATNCTCCNKGSYLQDGACVGSCDSGYQPFHVNYSSKFVFQQCQHCNNKCNVCPEGFTFVKEVCVQQSNCPDGMYFQWNSMSCKSCNSRCRACIGPSYSDCLSCYPPFGYDNVMRKCMKCCDKSNTQHGVSCCNCIETAPDTLNQVYATSVDPDQMASNLPCGKCDMTVVAGKTKPASSMRTVIMVVLVVLVCCLLTITGIAIAFQCQKRKSHPGVKYKQLLSEQEDPEDA